MYPNPINRALCSAGMTAGGSRTAHVLPTVRREANSSGVRGADSDAIIRLCPSACIGTWSTLLRWANKAASVGGPRWRALTNHPPRGHASAATWRVRAIAPVAADCHVKRGPVHTAAGREYDDGGSWSGSPSLSNGSHLYRDPFPASIVGPVRGRMPFAGQEMSYGGIPMSKMRQLRSSGGGILTPY
jgi:hypothetical protein